MKDKKWFRKLSGFFKFLTIFALLGLGLSYLSPFVHPDTLWILPFFGLLYPVFLFINILLLLLFLFARSRWSLVFIAVLLIGGKLHFRQFAVNEKIPAAHADSSFSVLSYNVRLFDLYNWSVDSSNINRRKIFRYLEEKQPDVACFQEFYHQDHSTIFPTRDTLVEILKTTGYHERYSHKIRGRQNFGIAILSKLPIVSKGDVSLQVDTEGTNDNYCVFVDVISKKDTIRIYNVHLQSIRIKSTEFTMVDENGLVTIDKKAAIENVVTKLRKAYPLRAAQSKLILDHAEGSPYPVIICGDFNDTPLSYTYQQFQKHYFDAFRNTSRGIGSTYAGRIPAGRIDYIFYDKSMIPSGFEVQKETFSDHRAIQCRFTLSKSK